MDILGINGSPRKQWNTATLLENALEGAASKGATTELVHLYDLDFKGCVSCFACKVKGGRSYGRCGHRDGLTPLLERLRTADGFIVGSPVYLGNVTGAVRSFMERLVFPYIAYDGQYSTLAPRKIPVGMVYTMNIGEERVEEFGYGEVFEAFEGPFRRVFGAVESLMTTDTLQFDDYSKYVATAFNEEAKRERWRTVFPGDCRRAFAMGARTAERAAALGK